MGWAATELAIMNVAQEVLQGVEESMESGAVVQDAVWVAILQDAHTVVVGQALTFGQVAGATAHLQGAEPAEGAATKATKVAETAAHLEAAAESSSTGLIVLG